MPEDLFDRSKLKLRPLSERKSDMTVADVLPLDAETPPYHHPDLPRLAERIVAARKAGREVIVLMGAHVIKQGLSRFIIDMMERDLITCLGMNGACVIHDYELARIGATTESVARYIRTGEFGLWRETGEINEIINAAEGKGFGEAIGEAIVGRACPRPPLSCHPERSEGSRRPDSAAFPHPDLSLLAAAHRLAIPATVHLGIGYDIIHEHPNHDGAKAGAASYRDFLIFAERVRHLEGGVFLCLGSAVMGPEVYLKALSMARNVERQAGQEIKHITTAVFDLADLGPDPHTEPPKTDPRYYFRPYKTILVRTVADGGESFYFEGDMRASVPGLWRALLRPGPASGGPHAKLRLYLGGEDG